jgi:HEXXH motif-containing protein
VTAREITKEELAGCFMPGDAALTQSLVRRSGLNRLREFAQMATYLAAQPDFPDWRDEVVDTLEQLDSEPRDLLFRRLASPVFRGWLSRFGGVEEYVASDAVLQRQLAFWGNMRHSLGEPGEYRASMAVVEGVVTSWDPRIAVQVGGRDRVVVVERAGRRLTIRPAPGETPLLDVEVDPDGAEPPTVAAGGCRVLEAAYLPDSEIALRNDLPPLHLELSGTAQRDDGVVFGSLDHSAESYPPFDPGPFAEASSIVAEAWPEEYEDFRQTLQVVVPRAARRGWRARGMTVSSHQGAIWIFVREVLDLVEHMVHEQSHVKLRYIEEIHPILEAEQTEERFPVGWRKDPRPIVGIYEGVYVHSHVLLALGACCDRGCFPAETAAECAARVDELRAEIREGLDLLVEHGRFTEAGRALPEWALECVESRVVAPA